MAAPEAAATPRVTGVILAAGRSTRFGRGLPKQLHKINGETLVCRISRTVLTSRLRQVVVVAGHRATEVGAAVAGLAVEVVDNAGFAGGQSTSVRVGLSRVEAEAEAVMFIPCDLPHLDAATIDRMLDVYGATGAPIVVPTVGGERRAPVLIDRSLFGEIEAIRGDRGARQLFPEHESDIVEVAFGSAAPFEDLDRVS